jgi:hypothetical protein
VSFQLRRSPGFDREWQRIVSASSDGDVEGRLAEALRAAEDALSRNPLIGREAGSAGVRLMTARPPRMMPLQFLWWHEDGTTLVLLIGVRQLRM